MKNLSPEEKDELGRAAFVADYPPINREGVEHAWPQQHPTTKAQYIEQALFLIEAWEELKGRRPAS